MNRTRRKAAKMMRRRSLGAVVASPHRALIALLRAGSDALDRQWQEAQAQWVRKYYPLNDKGDPNP